MNRKSRLTVVFLILYTAPCLSSSLSLSLTLVSSCHKVVVSLCAVHMLYACSIHAIVSEVPLMYTIGFLLQIFVPDCSQDWSNKESRTLVSTFFLSLSVIIDCQCSDPYGLTATYKNILPGEEVKECFFQCTPLHSSWSSPHASHLPV